MNSKELAKLMGVSQSTISRALNGSKQISEQRRQEIVEMARKLNFEFNLNARNLRSQTSNFVGIMLPPRFSSFIADDFRSSQFNYLYAGLSKQDLDPILLSSEELSTDVAALERAIKKRQLAGLILWRRIENDDVIEYLKSLRIPLFAMTRCNEKMQFIPSVSVDSYRMGYLIGEHFASRGHHRVALVRLADHDSSDLTTQGFRDGLATAKAFLHDEDIYYTGVDFNSGYNITMVNMDRMRGYDAVFSPNDITALGIIAALQDNGLSVPGDVAVAGNNDAPTGRWFSPKLTTVHTSLDLQATMTCERMVSLLKDGVDPGEEKHYVITPRLVIRESCP